MVNAMSIATHGGSPSTSTTNIGLTPTNTNSTVQITLKLSQLQNLCKRDPDGYRDEYDAQIRRLESELNILLLQPDVLLPVVQTPTSSGSATVSTTPSSKNNTTKSNSTTSNLTELIQFAAAVSSSSYKGIDSDKVANMLMNLLVGGGTAYINQCPDSAITGSGKKVKSRATYTNFNNGTSTIPHHVLITTSISSSAYTLHRDIRKSIVSALILMRNKGVIEPLIILQLFFRIMSVLPDKGLRELLYKHIVNDIRNINKKGKRDDILNRNIQSFLHRIVSSTRYDSCNTNSVSSSSMNKVVRTGGNDGDGTNTATDIAAKRSVDIVCELYRRRVWTDTRVVAIVTTGIESYNTTIMCRSIKFFLNIEEKMINDDVQKQIDKEAEVVVDYHLYSKKTAARQRQTERQIKAKKKALERKERIAKGNDNEDFIDDNVTSATITNVTNTTSTKNDNSIETSKKLYPAIELLRNPHGVAEIVFHRLRTAGSSNNTLKYEQKLLLLNFLTRLVGNHELIILSLYPYLQKYLAAGNGHQRDVTSILAYTVQACHEYIPPNEIYGILKTISTNFITERCSEEQMAVGINTIRAICVRVPTVLNIHESQLTLDNSTNGSKEAGGSAGAAVVMDIEAFVRDIAEYSKHKDRSVTIAARSWINYVRSVHPILLHGKDRGLYGSGIVNTNKDKIKKSKKNKDNTTDDTTTSSNTTSGPQRYGEMKIAKGVEGADLLLEYETKKQLKQEQKRLAKIMHRQKKQDGDGDDNDDEDEDDEWVTMKDGEEVEEEEEEDGDKSNMDENTEEWEEDDDDNDDGDEWEDAEEGEEDGADDDEVAPTLVLVDGKEDTTTDATTTAIATVSNNPAALDLSKLSQSERDKIKLHVSSTRIFTTEEFIKMRKLVDRENKLRTDPRARARQKRLLARGEDVHQLSDDDDDNDSNDSNSKDDSSSSSDDDDEYNERINIKGSVNMKEIMALSAKKRQNKAERLERVLAGRTTFETKQRGAGSTNTEKTRRKNFLMSKLSSFTKSKSIGKPNLQRKRKDLPMKGSRDQRKRRRRM